MNFFITIEGIEGSGKTTLIKLLAEHYREKGNTVCVTKEPGGTELGKWIRKLILNQSHLTKDFGGSDKETGHQVEQDLSMTPCPTAELLLFAADRAQHCQQLLVPSLAKGQLVLCDRFIHSTLAYQGYGRGICLEDLKAINQLATQGLVPDKVLLLDINPETALARARRRHELDCPLQENCSDQSFAEESSWTRFEKEELTFHQRIRQAFLDMASAAPQMFTIIDAEQPLATILNTATFALDNLSNIKRPQNPH